VKYIKITKLSVKLCPECFCSLFNTSSDDETLVCQHCHRVGDAETFWRDETGDRLFKLVSDVTPNAEPE